MDLKMGDVLSPRWGFFKKVGGGMGSGGLRRPASLSFGPLGLVRCRDATLFTHGQDARATLRLARLAWFRCARVLFEAQAGMLVLRCGGHGPPYRVSARWAF